MKNLSTKLSSLFSFIILLIVSGTISFITEYNIWKIYFLLFIFLTVFIGNSLLLVLKLLTKKTSWGKLTFYLLLTVGIIFIQIGISKILGNWLKIDFYFVFAILSIVFDLLLNYANTKMDEKTKNAD